MTDDAVNTPNTRITEIDAIDVGKEFPSFAEVYVSSEISERAPTKDRPDVTYGTTTKVTLTFDADDARFTEATIGTKVQALHGILENALQSEIMRRKLVREGRALGFVDEPTGGDVPF